jgi:uncharacterized protein (DUF1697 family)
VRNVLYTPESGRRRTTEIVQGSWYLAFKSAWNSALPRSRPKCYLREGLWPFEERLIWHAVRIPIMKPMALVIFLRGVNVGGHRTFRPSILANQLKDYGVVNIGAAGTFVVRKPVSQKRLRSELLRRLPFEAEVMMCTGQELTAAALDNPFDGEPARSDIVGFVSVLAKPPQVLPSIPIRLPGNGRWLLKILSTHDRFLFGCYRREMKVISCLTAIDKLFGVPVTTRNWNTISAILKVLEKG